MKKSLHINNFSFPILLILLITIGSLSSCRKEISQVNNPVNYTGNNFNDVFESFWNGMNNNYVFWSIDTTNWDRVYTTYKPLFAKLNLLDSTDNQTALKYFQDMTSGLIDSHYTLTFTSLGNAQISPSYNRKLAINQVTPDSIYALPSAMFTTLIPKNYIDAL
jgi:hypothetical protein